MTFVLISETMRIFELLSSSRSDSDSGFAMMCDVCAPYLPSLPQSWTSIRNGLAMILSALVGSLLLCLWLRRYLPRMPYFKGLILDASVGGTDAAMAGSLTNIDPNDLCPAVGARGTALTDLLPGGRAEFRDAAGGAHVVAVVSDSGFVPRGAPITVREAAGSRVIVRRADVDASV